MIQWKIKYTISSDAMVKKDKQAFTQKCSRKLHGFTLRRPAKFAPGTILGTPGSLDWSCQVEGFGLKPQHWQRVGAKFFETKRIGFDNLSDMVHSYPKIGQCL